MCSVNYDGNKKILLGNKRRRKKDTDFYVQAIIITPAVLHFLRLRGVKMFMDTLQIIA